jgi:hypothetical protein
LLESIQSLPKDLFTVNKCNEEILHLSIGLAVLGEKFLDKGRKGQGDNQTRGQGGQFRGGFTKKLCLQPRFPVKLALTAMFVQKI